MGKFEHTARVWCLFPFHPQDPRRCAHCLFWMSWWVTADRWQAPNAALNVNDRGCSGPRVSIWVPRPSRSRSVPFSHTIVCLLDPEPKLVAGSACSGRKRVKSGGRLPSAANFDGIDSACGRSKTIRGKLFRSPGQKVTRSLIYAGAQGALPWALSLDTHINCKSEGHLHIYGTYVIERAPEFSRRPRSNPKLNPNDARRESHRSWLNKTTD